VNADSISSRAKETVSPPPLRFEIRVPLPPERAFELFTDGIGTWWPIATHSVGCARVKDTRIEPRVGGGCIETWDDGQEKQWGSVLVWEPPTRFVMSWHPGQAVELAQEVEVRFTRDGAGSRVVLEHRDWHKLGEKAAAARGSYEKGWNVVFGEVYRQAAERAAGQ
jgi:uncharacterized protein YndB with AHSA1/START domain